MRDARRARRSGQGTKQPGQGIEEKIPLIMQECLWISFMWVSISSLVKNRSSQSSQLYIGSASAISSPPADFAGGETAPSSWAKVGAFPFPTVITWRLSEAGGGEGWWCKDVGAFCRASVPFSETEFKTGAGEASFFCKNHGRSVPENLTEKS